MSNSKDKDSAVKIEIFGGTIKVLHHNELIQKGMEKRGWFIKGGRSVRRAPKKPRT